MVSQEQEEGICDCHSVQESLQILNEQPSSGCAPTGNAPAAFACLVAFVSAGSTEPPGTPHHRADREQIVKVEKD